MEDADKLPLPDTAHVPGSGSAPDEALLAQVKACAAAVTLAARWKDNVAYIYGHRLFETGYYWEAHEVWEAVWMAAPANSAEQVLLRWLIQRANARLKRRMGRERAADRLDEGAEALRRDLRARVAVSHAAFMGVSLADGQFDPNG